VECIFLRNMVTNMSKGAHSSTSNQILFMNSTHGDLKERDTMHQLVENMEFEPQGLVPSNVNLDEVVSCHAFR
jgi:hypothetical protein